VLDQEELRKRIDRHIRFWDGLREGEGAYIAITCPDPDALRHVPPLPEPDTLEEKWFKVDYRIQKTLRAMAGAYYAGDAVPVAYASFGPANLSGLLGAPFTLTEQTIFFGTAPLIKDRDAFSALHLQRNSRLYQSLRQTTRGLAQEAKGRFVVGISDIGSNLDTLCSLRNRERLLVEMLETPRRIKDMFDRIYHLWEECYAEQYSWVTEYMPSMSAPTPLVYNGKWCKVESESSVLISPDMFDEFVLPALQRQVDYLDKSTFNLDGYDNARFLPGVLRLNGLHSVAWGPAPKYDSTTGAVTRDFTTPQSIAICKAIQAAGKKLILQSVPPDQVATLFSQLAPDGVFIFTSCADKAQADDLALYFRGWQNVRFG
jgi:hypothetical protein